jgi:hypothetical protein
MQDPTTTTPTTTARAIPTIGPVPRPVDSEDWLAAAADTVGKVEDALNDDDEEDKARVEVTVIAAGRVDEELGATELVDRVVWNQLHFEQVTELLTEDEGTARVLDTTALEVAALLAGRAAEMSLAAEDLTTAEEAAADLAELDWILDATPPTASVAAPAGVAGFVVLAAEAWRSAYNRFNTQVTYSSSSSRSSCRRSTVGRLDSRQLLWRQSLIESVFQ